MLFDIIRLLFIIPSSVSNWKGNLFEIDESRKIPECDTDRFLICQKVSVNFEALFNAKHLEVSDEIILTKTGTRIDNRDNYLEFGYQDKVNKIEGSFIFKFVNGQSWISGFVDWDGKDRHFRLDECKKSLPDEKDCFFWAEMDPDYWIRLSNQDDTFDINFEENLTEEHSRLLEEGKTDKTTQTIVTVTVHTTPQFRESFESKADYRAFIAEAITETNTGYLNSAIPITLQLHCIVESNLIDRNKIRDVLIDFYRSAAGNFDRLRRSADIAILLTKDGDESGVSIFNRISTGQTIGVVIKDAVLGYYSFGHEIAHMYGCQHNRESQTKVKHPSAFGYLMKQPLNSGYRTVLAYDSTNYKKRINFYSNPEVDFGQIPTGNEENDNAKLLIQKRFLMANVGKEQFSCSISDAKP